MRGLIVTLAVLEVPMLAFLVGIGFATGKWGYALEGGVGIALLAAAGGIVAAIRKGEVP